MFYYLYKITNNVNGKIYCGVHKTDNLDDMYMGSGKVIKQAIAKYGITQFSKTILEYFTNADEMFAREKEIVDHEFLLREDVYNLQCGGNGGFEYINKSTNDAYYELRSQNGLRFNSKTRARENFGPTYGEDNYFYGRKTNTNFLNNTTLHQQAIVNATSDEANRKRKLTFDEIKHQQGANNSQFGKIWVTDGVDSKRITLMDTIPDGWRRGRIMPNKH